MRSSSLHGALLAAILLGGCASTGGGTNAVADGTERAARQPLAGATADVRHLESEGLSVVATYRAASGRTCQRLADANGIVVARVSCLRTSGEWTLGRSLGSRSPVAVDASARPATRPVEPLSVVVPAGAARPLPVPAPVTR